jgi:hypothetical protein
VRMNRHSSGWFRSQGRYRFADVPSRQDYRFGNVCPASRFKQ